MAPSPGGPTATTVTIVETGGSFEELSRLSVRHAWHHAWQAALHEEEGPRFIVEGTGVFVRDAQGLEYLDGTSMLAVVGVGHGRTEIAEAMAAQAGRLAHCTLANGNSNVPASRLAAKLAEITAGDLDATFFQCSGAEAVETAIKMARQYQVNRGFRNRYKLIAQRGSFHGTSMGALSATGMMDMRSFFEPVCPGFIHVPNPYPYRCELGCSAEESGRRAAEALEREILFQGPETVAAFIAAPINVTDAVMVPTDDYWPLVREICDRYDILLIADEVLNGFGRTGKMFALEHWGVVPDIMTMAKGLTSGYVPLSGAIATRKVREAFWGGPGVEFEQYGTYSGHPVACAAALANIAIIEREGLVANAAKMGALLMEGLNKLEGRPFVGNISGRGLLMSMELVSDRTTKELAPREVGQFIFGGMADRGVLVRHMGNGIFIYPPLVINEEQIHLILDALDEALADAARRFGRN